jgi:diguanylate cyclase (GGDEF)-like protein
VRIFALCGLCCLGNRPNKPIIPTDGKLGILQPELVAWFFQGANVRRFFLSKSLHTQLVCVGLLCVVGMAGVSLSVLYLSTWNLADIDSAQILRYRMLAAMGIAGMVSLASLYTAVNRLLRPLRGLRDAMWHAGEGRFESPVDTSKPAASRDVLGLKFTFDRMLHQLHEAQAEQKQSKAVLAARTRTVDRLLEFSQSIQAAGKPEQVFATLTHFLQNDLQLTGLAMLSVEPESVPATVVRACYPLDLLLPDRPIAEMDCALCPCVRQHLPRHFRNDGSPVRCTIDSSLKCGNDHPAYCIPFTIGGKIQAVVHMLLAPARDWDDDLKQLAQTYVNTAQSTLVSLNLLAEAEKTSMTDGLTGLYNRRSLESLMQREVALAERHSHPLSLVMIDMDRFKEVNDAHGHAAGDHMLRSFADCVRLTLRRTDLAFRYGGDEFVIALPQTSVTQAQQVVAKLRQAYANVDFSDAIAKLDHQPTLSIGVVERSAENNALTLGALLSAADQALYEAKNNNRNCTKVYSPVRAA